MLDRRISFRTGVVLLLLTLLGLAAVVAFLLDDEAPAPRAAAPLTPAGTRPDAELAGFLGDAACTTCHPEIAETHRRSRHAATLHALKPGGHPVPLPEHDRFTDAETGLRYTLERREGRCRYAVEAPEGSRAAVADYAFGSGKTGITLVGALGEEGIVEFRMSYFPGRRRWEVTPGQLGAAADPLGHRHELPVAQRCFSCHATVIAASQAQPESRFLGVGCEACHGPGRPHVEAVSRGDTDHHIDNPGRWDGARVNALCGRCHRTERELDPLDTLAPTQTQRFQPIGLAKSACFRASAGRLTCVTCHDAHTNAGTDPAPYVAVCRSCHASATGRQGGEERGRQGDLASGPADAGSRPRPLHGTPPSPRPPLALARICPVNATDGCVGCHMPKREVVRGIRMADHWIRVYPSSATGGGELSATRLFENAKYPASGNPPSENAKEESH